MANTPIYIPELEKRKLFVDYRNKIWGDSFQWAFERTTLQVEFLVFHHSVTKHEATADDIAILHKARGWKGIGYHFVITKDGKVWYVGDLSTGRANVANRNEKVIGVCLIGDFTKHLPSDEQIMSAHYLTQWFMNQAAWPKLLNNENAVVGHKSFQATACPGESWPNDMRDRILRGIPYTPKPSETSTPAVNDTEIVNNDQIATPPVPPKPPENAPVPTPQPPVVTDPPPTEVPPATEAPKTPMVEAGREFGRLVILSVISYFLTEGIIESLLQRFFAEGMDPQMKTMVVGLVVYVLRSVDKWMHETAKQTGKEGLGGDKGLTGF